MSFILSLLAFAFMPMSEVSAAIADTSASYQTAYLYFLPDFGGKEETSKAEIRGCRKIGYTVTRENCAKPRILKGKCPVGNVYKECYCKGSPTCTGSTSSAMPYSSSKGAAMTSCVDCPGNTLYTWTCSRTCGADIYSKPSNSSYTTCTDCSGTHNVGWSCNYGYHKSGNSCEEDCGPSSYNWCPVHRECHVNCCTDGTIEPCDTRCGGSGCAPACTPMSSESGCSYGTYSCSDGCGGTRTCCSSAPSCTPRTAASGCAHGTESCDDGCGGTTTCCASCTPRAAATGCTHGTESCSDGCGGTTTCCKGDPCASVTCSGGKVCRNGTCECPSGKKECNNSCISSSGCCSNSDCGSNQECKNNVCVDKHVHSYSCPAGYSPNNSWGSCSSSVKQECSCGQKNTTSCYQNACTSSQKCYNGSCCTPTNSCSGYNLDSMSGCGGEGSNSSWTSNFYDECDTGCGKKYRCSAWGRCYNAGYTSSYCAEGWWESIVPCPYMSDDSPNCFNCGSGDQLYKCTGQIIRP